MKILRISIILLVFLANCVINNTQDIAFTPNQYYFALNENSNSTTPFGNVYITTNRDISTNFSSSNQYFQVTNSGQVSLQENIILDYENTTQHIITTTITESTVVSVTADVIICLLDLNDNTPSQPTPSSLTIQISVAQLNSNNIIVRFNSGDADSNNNGRVTFRLTNYTIFNISSAGVLRNIVNLAPGTHNVTVVAEDAGSPSLSSSTMFVLTVTDQSTLNLIQNLFAFTIDEDAVIGTLIETIPLPSVPVLALSPTPNNIQLNSTTGRVTVLSSLNYETITNLTFLIVNSTSTSIELGKLVIYINNVQDTPPTLSQTSYNISLPVDTPVNNTVWCVPALITGEEYVELVYALFGASTIFSINSNGIITLSSSILSNSISTLTVILELTDRTLSTNVTLNFMLTASNAPLPGVPRTLTVTNLGTGMINISWTIPTGIYPLEVFPSGLSYQITYRTLRNLGNVQTLTTTNTQLQVLLVSGEFYIIRVAAAILDANFGPVAITTLALGTENTMATTINSTAIQVSFNALQYCSSALQVQYDIQYTGVELDTTTRTINLNITSQAVSGTNTTSCQPQFVVLTGLQEYVNYTISLNVTIINLGVSNVFVAQVRNETFQAAPAAAPTNIVLRTLSGQSIQVTICPPAEIDQNGLIARYIVSYIGNPIDTNSQSNTVIVSLSYPATTCINTTLDGLEEFNNYTVTVQAVNSAGSSGFSEGVIAETNAAVSEAPSQLIVSNTTSTSFCITIFPPVDVTQNGPIESYTVSYQGELFNTTQFNVSVSVVATYPLTASSSVCINGLEEFNNYTVAVRAVNEAGEGGAITEVFRTLASVPITAPQNVSATSITATTITVCFNPPTGSSQNGILTSFDVLYTGSPFQTTQVVDAVNIIPIEYPLTRTVCTSLTNLEENNNYNISIQLTNSAGSGPASTDISVSTLEAVSEAPSQLMVSNTTSTSFCITVSPPVNDTQNGAIQSYTVSYQGELFNTTQFNVSVSVVATYPLTASSSVCINGLEEFNNYTVAVRAVNGAGEGAAITEVFRTLESVPITAPQNVSATSITATTITVCFNPPTGNSQNGIITSFDVLYTGSPFQTTQVVDTVNIIPIEYPLTRTVCTSLTDLEENNNYNISIQLTNSAGSGPVSTDISVLTPEAAPADTPTNIVLRTLGTQSIQVTICPPAEIDQNGLILRYIVSYTGNPIDTITQSNTVNVSLSYPATACINTTLGGLEEFNNYAVTVQAVNSAGSSGSSVGVATQTDAAVSEAPSQLIVSNTTSTSFCITIFPPVDVTQNGPIESYTVSYQGELFNTTQVNVHVSVVATYPLTASSSVCINGLEEFNNYTVAVRAVNGAGEGVAITDVFRTLTSAPITAPQNVSATSITATTITVCFDPPTGNSQNGIITSFDVLYTGSPFQTTQVVDTVNIIPIEYPLTRTVCTSLTDLEENNNYNISIQLTNSAGSGPVSTDISVLTPEAAPADTPTNIVLRNLGTQSIQVTICPPAEIDQNGLILRYIVSYTGNPIDTITQSNTVNVSLSYPATACINTTLGGLEEFNNYTVTVQAVNSAGSSDPSTEVVTETDQAVSEAPSQLIVSNTTSTSFCITTSPPVNDTQNGAIQSYTVSYQGELFNTTQVNVSVSVVDNYPLTASSSVCINELEEFNNYTVAVRAVNEAGEGVDITDVFRTLESAPITGPQNVSVTSMTATTITVCFDPPTGSSQNGIITSFNVTYTGSPFQTTQVVVTVIIIPTEYPLTRTLCINLTNLEENNNYDISIRLTNSAGSGPASTDISVSTLEAVSEAPSQLIVSNTTSTSFCIIIFPPVDVTQNGPIESYTVSYQGELFNTTQVNVSVSVVATYPLTASSSVCINGLEEFNNYTVAVRAVNGAGEGVAITDVFRTLTSAPFAAPLNVFASDVTATTFTVCFVPPTGSSQNGIITSFNVTRTGSLFQTTQVVATVGVLPLEYPLTGTVCTNITGLQENNSYTISIKLTNSAGIGPASTVISVLTPEAIPSTAPTNISLRTLGTQSIQVTICPPAEIDQNGLILRYIVSYTGNPIDTMTQSNTVNVSLSYPATACTNTTLDGLEEFDNYTVTVQAVNSAGSSGSSTGVIAETNAAAPSATPTISALTVISSQSIRVTICPPPQRDQNGLITNYNVRYSGDPFDTTVVELPVSISLPYPAIACTDTTLTLLEEYNNYTVSAQAQNLFGVSDFSTGVTEETNQAVSEAPSQLIVSNTTSTSLCITISPPVDVTQNGPIESYTVSYQGELFNTTQVNVSVSVVDTYPLTASSSVCINGLEEFNNYAVAVRAVNGAGEGAAITNVFRTLESVPSQAPQNVTVSTINATAIDVCFFPPQNVEQNGIITSFAIMYTGNPFETTVQSETVPVTPQVYPLSGMICRILVGLEEFNTYNISVAAVNEIGTGIASAGLTALTNEAAPSAAPQNSTPISGLNITLSYMAPPAIDQNGIITNYTIVYFGIDRDSAIRTITIPPDQFSVNITGLEEDTTYSFRIAANTIVGRGPFTQPVIASTQTAPPASPPINITVTVVNSTALNTTWRVPDIDEHNGLLSQVEIQVQGINLETTERPIMVLINDSNDTSVQYRIITGLEEFVNYSVILSVRNGAGLSPLSDPVFESTLQAAPSSPPQNVITQALRPTSIEVTFTPPLAINQNGMVNSYNVTYIGQTFDTTTLFVIVNVSNATYPATVETLSVNLIGLQEYNNYTVRVSAINQIGASPFSDGNIQITDIAVPSESPSVAVQSVSTTYIQLVLSPPASIEQNGPIIAYEISITTFRFNIAPELRNTTEIPNGYPLTLNVIFNASSLQEFVEYNISVRAYTVAGPSVFSGTVLQTTIATVPSSPPQNVITQALSPTSIRVTFTPPLAINQNGLVSSYNVTYIGQTFDTTTLFVIVSVSNATYPATVETLSVNLIGLQEYNNYTVRVSAINQIGASPLSDGIIQITDIAAPSSPPQDVVTLALSPTSIRVTFIPPLAINQNGPNLVYNVSYTGHTFETISQFQTVNVPNSIYPATAAESVTITGLEEYNNYTVRVSAINIEGPSQFTTGVIQITDIAVPSESPSVAVQSVSTTYIQLVISPPAPVEQNGPIIAYEISITTFRFNIEPELRNTTEIPNGYPLTLNVIFNVSSLQEFVEYSISVRAYTEAGPSVFSDTIQQTTDQSVPSSPPQNVITQVLSPISIEVTFTPPLAINQNGLVNSYNVTYIGQTFDTTTQFVIVSVSNAIYPATVETLSVNLIGLQEYNNYTVRVSAINQIGASPFSDGNIQITDIAVPSESPSVAVQSVSTTYIQLVISPPAPIEQNGPIIAYEINIAPELRNTTEIPNGYPLTLNVIFNASSLQEFVEYNISVRAYTVAGPSVFSGTVLQTTIATVPSSPPQNVITQALSPTSIRVTFTPPLAINQNGLVSSYNVTYIGQTFDTTTLFVIVSVSNATYPATVETLSVNLIGLQEYNNYTVRVSAINQIGASPLSDGIIQITDIAAPSSPPQDVVTLALSPTSIRVTFIPPLAINQNGPNLVYNVSYTGHTFETISQFQTVNVPNSIYPATAAESVTITGLEEYNNYTVRVSAINIEGPSQFTTGVIQITDIAVPSESPSVAVQSVSTTYIQLVISPPAPVEQNGPIIAYEISITTFRFNIEPELRNTTEIPNGYPLTLNVIFNVSSLQEFVEYSISVRAYTEAGPSVFSDTIQQTTDQSVPSSPPQNVITQVLSPISIEVTFTPPLAINQNGLVNSYNVTYIGQTFDTTTQFVIVSVSNAIYPATVETLSVNLIGLQEYNNYTVRVSAINQIGASPFSDGNIQITDIAVPSESPSVAVQSVSTTYIQLVISPPAPIEQNGPIIAYEISITTFRFNIAPELRNTTEIPNDYPLTLNVIFNASSLQEFVEYNISVRAYTVAGPSVFSGTVLQTTIATVPSSPPQNVITQALSPTSIRVTFTPPLAINQNGLVSSYNVTYIGQTFDTTTQFVIVSVSNAIYPATVETLSVNLIGLQEYNNYTVRVSAINQIGASPFSDGIIQITDIAVPSESPSVAVQSVSTTYIQLVLSPPAPIEQNGPIIAYEINITTFRFNIAPELRNTTEIPNGYPLTLNVIFNASSLQEFVEYSISVRAYTEAGPSVFSDTIQQTTDQSAPSSPPIITSITAGATNITVVYSPPQQIDQNGLIILYTIFYTASVFQSDTPSITSVNVTNRQYPDVTNRTVVLEDLEQYVNYTITIAATTVAIGANSTAIVIETLQEVSIAPLLISANSSNATTVCVIFQVPAPQIDQNGLIDQYFVNLSRAIDGPFSRTIPIWDPQYPAEILDIQQCFTDVEEGTNYTVSVRAGNGAGLGPSSNALEVNTLSVPPPNEPPFNESDVSIVINISRTLTLTIPDIDVSFLNGAPEFYVVVYQGFLFRANALATRRRKRQMDVIALTDILTIIIPINSERTIILTNILPNYVYVVNISIRTSAGQTPFVTITTPSLVAIAPSGPPLNLSAAAINDTKLQFNFTLDLLTLNGELVSFSIFYKEQGSTQETTQIENATDIGPYQVPIINLVANKVYLISVSVRNEIGEGPRSAEISATTDPSVPTTTTLPGTTQVPTSLPLPDLTTTIDVPTQTIYPTANIAVIYIITDYNNPPKFQAETSNEQYRLITSTPLMNGFVLDNEIDTNIRIQAALNSTFFFSPNQNSFVFIIGDRSESSYESRTFDNPPLMSGSTLYSYYYILFLNENAMTSPTFTLTSIPFRVTIPAVEESSPVGIVIALLLVIAILAGVIIALIVLIFWFMRRKNNFMTGKVNRTSSTSRGMSTKGTIRERTNSQKQEPINPMPVIPSAVIMKSTITLPNFAKYVEEMSANDKLRFHEEYMSIKDPPHTHDMCSMSVNGPRNRYRDIRTYDHSRVTLTQLDGDEYSDYINANFIHGYYKKNEYIAAQGPLDNTIADFWRMTWDWNVPAIIMLTKCVERGRRKCSQYWPDGGTASYSFYDSNGTSKDFISITIERETIYAHYIIREIVLSRVDFPNQQKRITQWHYTSWPDMGVPENGTSLLKFVQKVHQSHSRETGPMIVHCSAGVGRTGTFITLGCMMPMIREQSLVDVYNFVNRMRDSRNRMVQVEAQYVFIHDALLEFIQHGDTEVSGEDLDTYFRTLDSEEENGASKLLGQFKRLAYPVRPTEYTIAQSPQNKAKNRYVNILPYNNKRVKLTPVPGVENSDYINASYIDGYWLKNAFIATQGPLQGTIEDFWKMIWEQHVNTIIMLTSEVEAGRERCVHYWPDEQPEYYGAIMVDLLDTRMDEKNEFIIHEMKMTHTKENRIRKIRHFQYTGWHEREMPDSAKGLNKMILDIEQWIRSTNPTHPMVIHCSAGVGRTGVFIGIFNMIESIRHENTVDVFNTVRMMRYQRPAMVQTATQYRFCYIALIDYISTSSDSLYQNVPKK